MSPRNWKLLLIITGFAFLFYFTPFAHKASGAATGDGIFFDSGQNLGGNIESSDVVLGDLDGDLDLDAVLSSYGSTSVVYVNQGGAQAGMPGEFQPGQNLASSAAVDADLADLDGDGDLDIFLVRDSFGDSNEVWINQGGTQGGTQGEFLSSGQVFGDQLSTSVWLADLDGTNGPDAFVGRSFAPSKVWFNNGNGTFTDSGQSLDTGSNDVALGDVDGDNDLDAFSANGNANKVWINQGGAQSGTAGIFLDSNQTLGSSLSLAVALGDVDGDDDLDAWVGNSTADILYINQGGIQGGTEGEFSQGASTSTGQTRDISLSDLDDDGDLDAFLAKSGGNEVWFNQGGEQGGTEGVFTNSFQIIGSSFSEGLDLGDVDGDLDPDAFIANWPNPDKVYLNGSSDLPSAMFSVDRTTNEDGDEVYYQAEPGNALLPMTLSNAYTNTLEVHARIETTSSTITETVPYAPGEVLKFLNLVNPNPNPSEPITLTLSVTPENVPPTEADETDELVFYFIDGTQGLEGCFLCYTEWLGQLVGIDPIFDQLFFMPLEEQRESPLWPYYTALFSYYSPEISDIMAANPALLWEGLETIDTWTPAIQALSDGTGSGVTVTQQMVDDGESLFDGIKAEAGTSLAQVIQTEQDAYKFQELVGMKINQFWQEMVSRRPIEQIYITIVIR